MKPNDTLRLTFREIVSRDFEAVHAYASDPEVCKHMCWGPNTPTETSIFIFECQRERLALPRIDYSLGVVRQLDDQLIGVCSIHIDCLEHRAATIGYALRRSEWGKGYATETAQAFLTFGFEQLGMHRIWATCRTDNDGSAKVLIKVGMQYEGWLRHHVLLRGQWQDSRLYAIVAKN